MTGSALLSLVRGLWPQRVRTRLAVLYALLFLAGGTILLGTTFALVSNGLKVPAAAPQPSPKLLAACKQPAGAAQPTQHLGSKRPGQQAKVIQPSSLSVAQCKKAFQVGAQQAATNQRSKTLSDLHTYSVIGLLGLTVLSAGLGWLISGRVVRPVRRITESARRASEQHLGERLRLSGPRDELRELADTYDAMLDRLDLAFTNQRQFVANASHELRTPLTVMRTAIDVTLAKPTRSPEQLEAMAQRVRSAVERAELTIEALLTLAASNESLGVQEEVDLVVAVEDALDDVEVLARERDLNIERSLEPSLTRGNRVLLERLVGNLVQNAVRHNVEHGWVRLHTTAVNGDVVMTVANSGPPIADDLLPVLCEPFRRGSGRSGEGGVGLGLSIVRSVSEAHHGSLEMVSPAEGGLEVTVTLPRVGPAVPRTL